MSARPARIFLACGLVSIAAYLAVPVQFRETWYYRGVALAGIVAILAGVALNKPRLRTPWILFAAGQACFFVGDWLFSDGYETPSIADAFYLAGYPLLFLGLFLIVRARNHARNWSSVIDATTIARRRGAPGLGVPHGAVCPPGRVGHAGGGGALGLSALRRRPARGRCPARVRRHARDAAPTGCSGSASRRCSPRTSSSTSSP